MGKYDEVRRLRDELDHFVEDKMLMLTTFEINTIAEYLYHREIGWKKIIQCLLWLRGMGVAEIHLEDMSRASGNIKIRNYDSNKLVVGAGRPVDKATR